MSNPYAATVSNAATPQSEPLFGRDQVANRARGYVFKIDPWEHLDRFLILGTEGGTYYATERELTREACAGVLALIASDGPRVVAHIAEVSHAGRAPRNTPVIFALAAASVLGDEATKAAANAALPKVCRIGTHLFQWAESLRALNGHGPSGAGQRRALVKWYLDKSADDLAYDLAKYQQREGWSHRDLLRLCKPGGKQVTGLGKRDYARRSALSWATRCEVKDKETGESSLRPIQYPRSLPKILKAYEEAKAAATESEVVKLIADHGLVREMVPSQWLNSAAVWEALLADMPMTAMVRNLGKMTAVGLLKPLSAAEVLVARHLADAERIRKARLHPVALLNALKVYGSGHGVKGSLSWTPAQGVLSALETAFDLAFQTVEPCGKRLYLAIDGSGSMTAAKCIGLEALACVEGAAAMAMTTARREERFYVSGFDTSLRALAVTKATGLGAIVRQLGYGGGTDASIPFKHAMAAGLDVDVFVVYTDSETWAGVRHPCVALETYRQKSGIAAKLAVVAMSCTEYSIGDRADAGTVNVVGFDSAAPALIADFARGGAPLDSSR